MGVFTYESKFTSVIPPARLCNAFVLDADNLIPKIAPQAVKSTKILEGDGGVGTIKKINFSEGSTYSYVKHRIDGVVKDNFVYKYSVIEGDAISERIEKFCYETKLVASGSGCIIKSTSHYHTKVASSRAPATTTPRDMLKSRKSMLRLAKRRPPTSSS